MYYLYKDLHSKHSLIIFFCTCPGTAAHLRQRTPSLTMGRVRVRYIYIPPFFLSTRLQDAFVMRRTISEEFILSHLSQLEMRAFLLINDEIPEAVLKRMTGKYF